MKFYIEDDGLYRLKISKRNALALLSKLEQAWSVKSIMCNDIYLDGEPVEPGTFEMFITIEDDATHYADRMAGPMHPDTETDINGIYKPWDVT